MNKRINVNTEREGRDRQTRTTSPPRGQRNAIYIIQNRRVQTDMGIQYRARDFRNDEDLTGWASEWEVEGHQVLSVESPSQSLRRQARQIGSHPPVAFIEVRRDGRIRVNERKNRLEIGAQLF